MRILKMDFFIKQILLSNERSFLTIFTELFKMKNVSPVSGTLGVITKIMKLENFLDKNPKYFYGK